MTLILLALALLAASSSASDPGVAAGLIGPGQSGAPQATVRPAVAPPSGSGPGLGSSPNGGEVTSGAPQAGRANYANPSHGPDYLAIRADRGTLVRITGAGGSWVTRSTDYGPDKDTGDIADIALVQFARICGWTIEHARRMGECDVTVERLGDVRLPETDTAQEMR